MADEGKLREERLAFEAIDLDSEDLIGFEEIGPDSELDEGEREAIAELDAGKFVSNEAVVRWLRSWGTDNELPPPQCGE